MSKPKILATGPLDDYSEGVLGKFGDCIISPDTREETLLSLIDGAVALAVRGVPPITANLINSAKDLKVIGRSGVGYSNVDVEAATARGIPLIYTPGAGARAVAEASITFMLALCKQLVPFDRETKKGNWNSRFDIQGSDMDGATLGIIGLGRIGQDVAQLASVFDMKLIGYDPYLDDAVAAKLNIEKVELKSLYNRSDFIAIHCAETPETRGLINAESIQEFKKGVYLINLSRGSVIGDMDALCDALKEGRIAGAGLDVYEPEPPNFDHPIFKLDNVLTTPHAMATTRGAMKCIYKSMADDMAAVLEGKKPRFVVNPEVL